MSVRKLTKIGFEVKFIDENCSILKDNICVATGSSHKNLYILDCCQQECIKKNQFHQAVIRNVEPLKGFDVEISLVDGNNEEDVVEVNNVIAETHNVNDVGEEDNGVIVNENSGDDTIVNDDDPTNGISFNEIMVNTVIYHTDGAAVKEIQ